MTHKRKLQRQASSKRRMLGEAAGRALVEWLNCEGRRAKRTAAHSRIELLLDSLRYRTRPGWNWDDDPWTDDSQPCRIGERGKIVRMDKRKLLSLAQVQERLAHYRMAPQIDPRRLGSLGMAIHWMPPPGDEEATAVRLITWLGERALLWRMRRCKWEKCGRWFYARAKRSFFHSTACRVNWHTQTPAGREKRTKYMRDYRKMTEGARY